MPKKTTLACLLLAAGLAAITSSFAEAKQPGQASNSIALSRAYLCIEGRTADEVTEKANEAGARGWKMVSAAPGARGSIWCFEQLEAMRPAGP